MLAGTLLGCVRKASLEAIGCVAEIVPIERLAKSYPLCGFGATLVS